MVTQKSQLTFLKKAYLDNVSHTFQDGIQSLRNSSDKADVVVVMSLHGNNTENSSNKSKIRHVVDLYSIPNKNTESYDTSKTIETISIRSKYDANFIVNTCYGGQAGINVLLDKSLRKNQSAIFLSSRNKVTAGGNRASHIFSIIGEHCGVISDKLINDIKKINPSTFSVIKDSKLTKYSRVKCDNKRNLYRNIMTDDKKNECWDKDKKTIEYIKEPK